MGYLHEGHLSLIRRARQECDHVVVSIFVNPTQFGPNEDLSRYPRDLDRDLSLIEPLGTDLVWMPTAEMMYPDGYQTWVEVEAMTRPLEGAMRPGHFRGVTTIVAKLFNGVQPHKAYFGQKDAQQAVVIRRMVRDLDFPVRVEVLPIVREPDGLAMSSRNAYLEPADRARATALSRALTAAERQARSRSLADGLAAARAELAAAAIEPEYLEARDAETLEPVEQLAGRPVLVAVAARVGAARLIDNVLIQPAAKRSHT
jgi:pantoate--beta-alanine ligase